MKHVLLTLLFGLVAFLSKSQVPSVSYIDVPGNEDFPTMIPASNGGFYVSNNITKSNPDSIFASITYLNASLIPQWNRTIKTRSYTSISGLSAEDGGASVMLNSYNTQAQSIAMYCRFDQNGNVVETIELLDSSTANLTTSPFFKKIELANGGRIFSTTGTGQVVHVNAQGNVDFARQFRFGNPNTNVLASQAIAHVPGTNQWYMAGYINNTRLAYVLKFQDTTMLFSKVFDFKPLAATMSISNIHVLPNQEVLLGWNDNSRHVHNVKLSANGDIIWRKLHKMTSVMAPGQMTVTSNGHIWMHGSITAGQAGGLLVHLSPTGEFIGRKGQFKLGNNHGNISTLVEQPNNEIITLQRGSYESKSVFFVNRISTAMDFYCFDSNVGNLIDTTYAIADSSTTLIKPVVKKFGVKTMLSNPLSIRNQTVTTGTVECTPTEISSEITKAVYVLSPNPASKTLKIIGMIGDQEMRVLTSDGRFILTAKYAGELSIENLKQGLYLLEVPSLGLRKRFLKE